MEFLHSVFNSTSQSSVIAWVALAFGLAGLTFSADRFVYYAVSIAERANLSTFFIGMTIVAIGTSAPEILVSIMAAITGNPKLAIGNALGSNIANTTLVLGITLIIAPIVVKPHILKKELPLLLGITFLTGWVLFDLKLNLADAFILFGAALGLLIYISYQHFKQPSTETNTAETAITTANIEPDEPIEAPIPLNSTLIGFCATLALLIVFSRILVWGGVSIATSWGVSDALIGLTIIAIGTSLPELAASIASAIKQHHGMALGNVIGSNVLNILLVLPWPGLLAPTHIETALYSRDYILLLAITLGLAAWTYLCFLIAPSQTQTDCNPVKQAHPTNAPPMSSTQLGRPLGLLLTSCYIGYITFLIITTV